jgi:hypothetical protein
MSLLPIMTHALSISTSWICPPSQHTISSTSHEAPHYAVPVSCYFFLLGSKYLLQHPILRHTQPIRHDIMSNCSVHSYESFKIDSQPMCFPACERPIFTPRKIIAVYVSVISSLKCKWKYYFPELLR